MATTTSILVHACCGPCALEPLRWLQERGYEPTIFWANANIQPLAEYHRRLETLLDWAAAQNITVVQATNETWARQAWEARVAPFGFDRERRCRACYALRLASAAATARELGFSLITTTLAVSPYQLFAPCEEVLGAVARAQQLKALWHDWRPCYGRATQRARELGLYRQNYCGCRFSAAEAQLERQAARDARKAAKKAARAAPSALQLTS